MIAHLIGGRGIQPCSESSEEAKEEASRLRNQAGAKKHPQPNNPSSSNKRNRSNSTNTAASQLPNKKTKQSELKVYRGVNIPFSRDEAATIQRQFLRAAISANLPFRAFQNPEMVRLFGMFRTTAPDIIPSAKVLGGRLLNEAAGWVDEQLHTVLFGKDLGLS
jgi:hypothetical protein